MDVGNVWESVLKWTQGAINMDEIRTGEGRDDEFFLEIRGGGVGAGSIDK